MDPSSNRLALKAQNYAADGNYEQALECYDKLVLQHHRKIVPVEILNSRSAIFLKLRRFSEAGLDGRHMIRHFPADSRGYLRLAQVFRYQARQSNDEEFLQRAVRILQSGLKRVDRSHRDMTPQIKLMHRICDDIEKQMKRQIIPDPASRLPLEVFQQVLSYCSSKDLVKWLGVSKNWRLAIQGATSWRSLDIGSHFMPKSNQGLKLLLDMATTSEKQCNIVNFSLEWDYTLSKNRTKFSPKLADVSKQVVTRCSHLQRILLDFHPEDEWHGIFRQLNHRSLTRLEILPCMSKTWETVPTFWALSELRDRNMPLGACPYDDTDICSLMKHLPSLAFASFGGFRADLRRHWQWPGTNHKLRSLRLNPLSSEEGHSGSLGLTVISLPELARFAPTLEELELSSCVYQDLEYQELSDLKIFPGLKRLWMDWHMPFNGGVGFYVPFPSLPSQLEDVFLEASGDVVFVPQDHQLAEHGIQYLKNFRVSWHFIPVLERILEKPIFDLEGLVLIDRGSPHLTAEDDTRETSDRWISYLVESLASSNKLATLRSLVVLSPFIERTPDNLASLIAKSCPLLETLTIAGDCGFTGVGISALCTKIGQNLNSLDVGRCPKAGADVRRYVRSLGIDFKGRVGPM